LRTAALEIDPLGKTAQIVVSLMLDLRVGAEWKYLGLVMARYFQIVNERRLLATEPRKNRAVFAKWASYEIVTVSTSSK